MKKAVCPVCGKGLRLIPTDVSLLPDRVKKAMGDNQVYLVSRRRILSYNCRPEMNFIYPDNWLRSADTGIVPKDFLWINNKAMLKRQCPGIASVFNTQKKLNKGGLFLFGWEMVFHCAECKQKLELNFNPFAVWSSSSCLFAIISAVFAALAAFGLAENLLASSPVVFFALLLLSCVIPLCAVYSLAGFLWVRLFMSNFVPTNEVDNLVRLTPEIKAAGKQCNPLFMRRGNVFCTELDGMKFSLLLTEKSKKDYGLHICGKNGEPERLTSLIREKLSAGERAVLPLNFEGRLAGNADIISVTGGKRENPGKDRRT